MNIFVVHPDPAVCAAYLDDKRLVKMVLETTQLLSNAVLRHCGTSPYKPTHVSHPCSLWAGDNLRNFNWLFSYGQHLLDEYTHRYARIHKCREVLEQLSEHAWLLPPANPDTPIEFVYCGYDVYSPIVGVSRDVHEAYRFYLQHKWADDARAGKPPKWYRKEDPSRYLLK